MVSTCSNAGAAHNQAALRALHRTRAANKFSVLSCTIAFRSIPPCSDADAAENQAALRALHALQRRHAAAWAAASTEGRTPGAEYSTAAEAAADKTVAASAGRGVEVLQGGRGLHLPIQPGSRVKV